MVADGCSYTCFCGTDAHRDWLKQQCYDQLVEHIQNPQHRLYDARLVGTLPDGKEPAAGNGDEEEEEEEDVEDQDEEEDEEGEEAENGDEDEDVKKKADAKKAVAKKKKLAEAKKKPGEKKKVMPNKKAAPKKKGKAAEDGVVDLQQLRRLSFNVLGTRILQNPPFLQNVAACFLEARFT